MEDGEDGAHDCGDAVYDGGDEGAEVVEEGRHVCCCCVLLWEVVYPAEGSF